MPVQIYDKGLPVQIYDKGLPIQIYDKGLPVQIYDKGLPVQIYDKGLPVQIYDKGLNLCLIYNCRVILENDHHIFNSPYFLYFIFQYCFLVNYIKIQLLTESQLF